MYSPAGHVVTVNPRIVEDKHIREILIKGPSFREQIILKIKSIVLDVVFVYKTKWAKKEHFEVRTLKEYHSTLVNRINVLKHKKQAWKEQ